MELEVTDQQLTGVKNLEIHRNQNGCLELYCDTIQVRKHSLEDQHQENIQPSLGNMSANGEIFNLKGPKGECLSQSISKTKVESRRDESINQSTMMSSPDSKTDSENKANFLSGLQTMEMSGAASVTKERPSRACKKGKDPRLKLCANPDCSEKSLVRKRFCNKTGLYCQVRSCRHPVVCQHDRKSPILSHLFTPDQPMGRTFHHMQGVWYNQPCHM
jgi:hypothetical protein